MRTLVLGGARSGKSAHAEGLLLADAPATYVATGRPNPDDAEWSARIAAHAARRPAAWRTVESDVIAVLRDAVPSDPPILVDDVVTWLANVLDDTGAWDGELAPARAECYRFVAAVGDCRADLVLVSAEVGLGVVPQTRSGRLFRDELGALNAALADCCGEVVLMIAGIPLRLR